MVLLNSEKGKNYFDQIKPKIEYKKVRFETIISGNPVLMESLGKPKVNRELFFQDINNSSFYEVAEKYFPFHEPTIKQQIKKLVIALLELKNYSRLPIKTKYHK